MKDTSAKLNSALSRSQDRSFFKPTRTSKIGISTIQRAEINSNAVASTDIKKTAPAWTEGCETYISPFFFAAKPEVQQEILRHEQIHAWHQERNGGMEDNSPVARANAETLASGQFSKSDNLFFKPAPKVLGFSPQSHAPWNKVYLGYQFLIGEIVESGITLRILIPYKDLGIKQKTKKTKLNGKWNENVVKDLVEVYHCGKHPHKSLSDYVKALKNIAKQIVTVNQKLPAGSAWRTELVVIAAGVNEAYRTANGKGVIELEIKNIKDTIVIDSAAHEAAHGIFEHHRYSGNTDKSKVKPDNFALNMASVYMQLSKTKLVEMPTKKFNSKMKPVAGQDGGVPAGIIMVFDTLWSGKGGHPWDGVDEFFASAYGAYLRDPKLLEEIIDMYASFDSAINSIKPVLLNLLKSVGDQNLLKSLKSPKDLKEAQRLIKGIKEVPDHTNGAVGVFELMDPTILRGPSAIKC